MIVDLRNKVDFDRKHIEGSINIPENRVKMSLKQLKSYDKVIFACISGMKARKMEHRYKNILNKVTSINIIL